MTTLSGRARTAETYIAGLGVSGGLVAAALVAFLILIGIVIFNAWPQASGLFGGEDSAEQASVSNATPEALSRATELVAPAGAGSVLGRDGPGGGGSGNPGGGGGGSGTGGGSTTGTGQGNSSGVGGGGGPLDGSPGQGAGQTVGGAVGNATNGAGNAVNGVGNTVGGVNQGLGNAVNGVGNTIKGLGGN